VIGEIEELQGSFPEKAGNPNSQENRHNLHGRTKELESRKKEIYSAF